MRTIRTAIAAAVATTVAFGATPAFAQEAGEVLVNADYGTQAALDSDGDGIPDAWEEQGVVLKDGTVIPLPDWGADPNRPDVFLQLNWMQEANGRSFAPSAEMLEDMVALFDTNGITLHIDAGKVYTNIANYDEPLGGDTLAYSQYYFDSTHKSGKLLTARSGLGERKNIFHLGVIGDQTMPGSWVTGEATVGTGSFFVAKHARMTEDEQLRNTILHEFGHNLGLRHNGAADHVEGLPGEAHDPAYRSVMNYKYQVGDNAIFDYSHEPYTYNYNGVTKEIPADWDNLKLADGIIGQHFATYGPGQTKPVNLEGVNAKRTTCLLYTSPSPRDRQKSRMPSSA